MSLKVAIGLFIRVFLNVDRTKPAVVVITATTNNSDVSFSSLLLSFLVFLPRTRAIELKVLERES